MSKLPQYTTSSKEKGCADFLNGTGPWVLNPGTSLAEVPPASRGWGFLPFRAPSVTPSLYIITSDGVTDAGLQLLALHVARPPGGYAPLDRPAQLSYQVTVGAGAQPLLLDAVQVVIDVTKRYNPAHGL